MQLTLKTAAVLLATALFTACGEPAAEADVAETNTATSTEAASTTYTVNTESSKVLWKGSMLGAHSHEGTLNFTEGNYTIQGGKVIAGKFTVDMTTINPTDDGYSEENPKANLVGHLSSGDFFDVENNPTAMLELMEGGKAMLTVRGKTNEVSVSDITVSEGDTQSKAKAKLTFDRTKFDVAFVHPVKEMVLSDDIELSIEVSGTSK